MVKERTAIQNSKFLKDPNGLYLEPTPICIWHLMSIFTSKTFDFGHGHLFQHASNNEQQYQ